MNILEPTTTSLPANKDARPDKDDGTQGGFLEENTADWRHCNPMGLRKRKACTVILWIFWYSVMFANQYQAAIVKKLTMWWHDETFTHIYIVALYSKRWSNITNTWDEYTNMLVYSSQTNTNTSCNNNKWKLCCAKKNGGQIRQLSYKLQTCAYIFHTAKLSEH